MKNRPKGFLSPENIDHDSECFDYIKELHEYMWRFVKSQIPEASGNLSDYIDKAIEIAESEWQDEDDDDVFGTTDDDSDSCAPIWTFY